VPGRVRAIPYLAGQVRRRHFAIESSSAVQKDCFTIPPSNLTLIDFPILVVTLIVSPSISLFSPVFLILTPEIVQFCLFNCLSISLRVSVLA
jgi:hypothetical protein